MKKILLTCLLLSSSLLLAQNKVTSPYKEGMHYKNITPVYATDNTQQVIVYEFFGYKCPHCASFQPSMKSLHKDLPDYVKVIPVPLGFNPSWRVLAQGYYTAQSLGVIEQSHQAMFDAIHKQGKKFRSIDDIADWYATEYSVDKKEFLATANSFMIDGLINKGNNLAVKMNIPNTPKLVINGKFMPEVTALGSNKAVIDLTKYLIEQEAKSMGLLE
jgi:thiol:disulfide interchange protein DsbA